MGLLLVLNDLTGQSGIRNSSAMLILIADTLHLLGRDYEAPLPQTCTHGCTHRDIYKKDARREDFKIHRLMKKLKYPKVGGWKKQKNKRTERRNVKWKDTKNKERHKQETNMAQDRQKRHTEERNPR